MGATQEICTTCRGLILQVVNEIDTDISMPFKGNVCYCVRSLHLTLEDALKIPDTVVDQLSKPVREQIKGLKQKFMLLSYQAPKLFPTDELKDKWLALAQRNENG